MGVLSASTWTVNWLVEDDILLKNAVEEVARTWKVEAMPTFVLVKNGKEVSRVVGAKKDELERKVGMFRSS